MKPLQIIKNHFLTVFFFFLFFSVGYPNNKGSEANLSLSIEGKKLNIEAYIPKGTWQIELRIESSRNDKITRFSTISPYDRDSVRRKERYARTPYDTWYPVVDIELEQGMDAVCIFKGNPKGKYTFGGPFYNDEEKISEEIIIPTSRLEYWENSLRVSNREIEPEKFYLRKTYPIILREFRHTISLLSPDWSGTISIWARSGNDMLELARKSVKPQKAVWHHTELEDLKGTGLNKERLLLSLETLINEGMRRQNTNPSSPTYGSFHTFYDFEARLHRTSYWLWGGSPIVKMVCDAIQIPEIKKRFNTAHLLHNVNRIGKLYLKYQVREPEHPSRGSFVVIWGRSPSGYSKWVGTSDSGIMHKWALMPLFLATGDSAYLEAAEFWSIEKGKLLKNHEILPHNYRYDIDEFSSGILDETGWDPEGHAALYSITGKEIHRQVAKEYMTKHMAKFQNENGLWNRNYNIRRRTSSPPNDMTRGTGWAMEGLLAMNSMFPDTIYLEYAKKMADHLVKYQKPNGSWLWVFSAPEGDMRAVTTDKGTPLWSLLMYRIYKATNDERYLNSARKALKWCLDNQYTGPDPEGIGGLVGRTNASMVGYRYYYDASCAYSTGFFGLAILEELKLMGEFVETNNK